MLLFRFYLKSCLINIYKLLLFYYISGDRTLNLIKIKDLNLNKEIRDKKEDYKVAKTE